jgi:hypothetical protein
MSGPAWMPGALAGVMALTALTCAARLVLLPRRERGGEVAVDLLHVVMGAVMAAMLLGRLDPRLDLLWLLGFAFAGLWFVRQWIAALLREGWASRAAGHGLAHGLVCAAMLVMLLGAGAPYAEAATPAMPAGSGVLSGALPGTGGTTGMAGMAGMAGMTRPIATGSLVPLTGAGIVMASVIAVLAAWQLRALVRAGGPAQPRPAAGAGHVLPILQPRWAGVCQIAMCVTMAYALAVMV